MIKNGTLRGVAGLVSCTTLRDSGQDSTTIAVAKELIKNDVLVLAMGCGNAALQVAGLEAPEAKELAGPGLKAVCELLGIPPVLSFGTCTDTGRIMLLVGAIADALGVDVPALPVVATAPEYMEQKATIDAMAALAFGMYVHVSPVPFVTGAPRLVKLVTEDLPSRHRRQAGRRDRSARGRGRHAGSHRSEAGGSGHLNPLRTYHPTARGGPAEPALPSLFSATLNRLPAPRYRQTARSGALAALRVLDRDVGMV